MEQKKYTFKPRTTDAVKKRATGNKSERILKEGFKTFTAIEGENIIRVLPNTWDENPLHYGYDVFSHYSVGPDKAQFLCLDKMKLGGGKCPVCEQGWKPAYEEYKNEPEANKDRKKELKEYAYSLSPKKQVAMWIIDRKNEALGPQIYLMPDGLDREFTGKGIDPLDGSLISIENPDEGYDIIFTRTGKLKNTKYNGEQVARRSTSLSTEHGDKWLTFVIDNPLPKLFITFSYEYIDAAYNAKQVVTPNVDDEVVETASTVTVAQEEQHEAVVDSVDHETQDDSQEVTFTYEELASLSADDLVGFAKENAILTATEIKMALMSNSVLSKVCAKLSVPTPAPAVPEASAPVTAAKPSYRDKLRTQINTAKATS